MSITLVACAGKELATLKAAGPLYQGFGKGFVHARARNFLR